VGEDGRGYEGTTPQYIGAHTGGYNSVGHAISAIGDFTGRRPNDAALMAVQHIIDCALNQVTPFSNYKLLGLLHFPIQYLEVHCTLKLVHAWTVALLYNNADHSATVPRLVAWGLLQVLPGVNSLLTPGATLYLTP
jgi:hypothetical protein